MDETATPERSEAKSTRISFRQYKSSNLSSSWRSVWKRRNCGKVPGLKNTRDAATVFCSRNNWSQDATDAAEKSSHLRLAKF